MVRVGGVVGTQGSKEWEDAVSDDVVHVGGSEVLEARPAEGVVGAAVGVLAFGKDSALHRPTEPDGLVLLQRLQVVEAAKEEQVGDLLDDLKRIGDAAGPEGVPDAIDLASDLAGQHDGLTSVAVWLARNPACLL